MQREYHVGAIGFSDSVAIEMGPTHPSRAGVVRFHATLSSGAITNVDITPGYLHRSAEKLFEVRDYRALLMLADRHDWHSAFSGELLAALVAEQALGLVPPPRATWLRTLLAELARITSHLAFCGYVPHRTADASLTRDVSELIEALRRHWLGWTGNRVHPMLTRLGGLASDAPDGWLEAVTPLLARVVCTADRLDTALGSPRVAHWPELGRISIPAVYQFGLSGPVARASGADVPDWRETGYLAYQDVFTRTVPSDVSGSVAARFAALIADLRTSADICEKSLQALGNTGGPVGVKLAKIIKLPEGEFHSRIEAPWGWASALCVSRGERTPWRFALRTPTFANVSALELALVGATEEEMADVIASLGYAIGDLDK